MKLVLITDTGERIEARCDRCRHWEGGEVCQSIQPWSGAVPHNGAWIDLTKDDGAVLGTRPDFGCALFEVKL